MRGRISSTLQDYFCTFHYRAAVIADAAYRGRHTGFTACGMVCVLSMSAIWCTQEDFCLPPSEIQLSRAKKKRLTSSNLHSRRKEENVRNTSHAVD